MHDCRSRSIFRIRGTVCPSAGGGHVGGSTYRFSGELLTDHPELVDASDFDNTKSGTYIISVRHNDEIASFSVEVADGAPVTTTAVTEMTYISYPSHTFDGDVTGHCLDGIGGMNTDDLTVLLYLLSGKL